VIATNVAGETDAYSAASAPVIPPPVNTSVPTVGGTPQDSQLLTAGAGTWQYSPTSYTYQWQYSTNGGSTWSNINGATNNTYTVPYSTYDGDKLRAQVTATNGAGSTVANSAATTVVVPVAPSNTAAPAVSGTAQVGQVLSSNTGSWNGTPTITYSYHWQTSANGSSGWTNISSATSATYTAESTDAGNYLRVEVTATNGAGSTFVDSAATGQVLSAIPVGAVIPYAGQTPVPTGWALADGSCGYTSASYPDLWAAIGTTYGGTGSSNFCLPDMRGKMALGKANSGIGSSLGSTGGALDQTGTVNPFGSVTENYSWTETPPSPTPIAHSHSMPGSGHLSNNSWPNFTAWEAQPSTTGTSCCGTGSPVDSLASASESWTTNASGTITASASFTPQASYSVSNPPYTVVRYLVSVLKTASTPCGALWGYGAAAAPSGAQLANGAAATGSLPACLDAAFSGNVPDLRGRIPVGLTNSGSAATLAATGGSIDQTVSGTLTAAATQTTVTPPGWSDTMNEDSHTHTYSGVRRSDAGQGGNANGTASNSSAPTVGANSNAGAVYTSNVYSPGALAASGAGAQSPSSSSFSTAFETLSWVAYTSASYAPATGTITGYAGTGAPSGWLLADGSCYSTSGSYASLYAVIGYTYGGSGGSFCVPDLRGSFALGKATAGTGSSLGANGGTLSPAPQLTFSGWTPQLTVPTHNFLWSVPAHTHRVAFSGSVTLGNAGGFIGSLRDGTVTSASTGGGSVSTSVNSYVVNATDAVAGANSAPPVAPPPFLVVAYIVKD
jgi:microcystin-dependent protein